MGRRGSETGGEDHEGDGLAELTVEAPGIDEQVSAPWPLLMRRRMFERAGSSNHYAWIVTAVLLFGMFWVASTITILSVSRPSIAVDLGASVESLVWLISGPTVAFALTGTTAGKLGDLYGHRRIYLGGMIGAALFALLSAVAWSGPSLIAFRVLGATVGAAAGPCSLAIINRLFAPDERSKALGFWSLVVAGGPVVGLVIGGPLVENLGWRVIFWAQAPLLGLALVAAWVLLPATPRRRSVHFDVAGQSVLFLALGALLFGIDRGAAWGFSDPRVLISFIVVPMAGWGFARVERRVQHPLIPTAWFTRRAFAVPVAVSFFIMFGYMGGFTLTPKLLAEVRDMTPETISLVMVPRPLTFAIAGPVAGLLAARITARATVVTGMVSLVLSMAMFAWVAPDPGTAVVVVALTLSGIGIGAAQPRVAASVANAVDDEDLGIAGATQQLFAHIGTAVGMNLLETVQVSTRGSAGLGGSYRVAYGVGAAVSAVGLLLATAIRDRADGRAGVAEPGRNGRQEGLTGPAGDLTP
jgi:EmrB/QacA subfamily drug resistance transporter